MQTAIKSMPFFFLQTIGLDELHFSYVSGLSTGAWLGSGVIVGATVVVGDTEGLEEGEAVGQYPGDFFPLASAAQHPHLSMESFGLSFELGFTQVVFNCVAPLLVFAMQTAIKSMPFFFLQTIGLDELHFSYESGCAVADDANNAKTISSEAKIVRGLFLFGFIFRCLL